MTDLLEIIASAFIVTGGLFALLGSLGLFRFPDLLTRLHGPSKASTLGIGGLLLGAMIVSGGSLREILIALFIVLTAPVSALCIARAARARAGSSDIP